MEVDMSEREAFLKWARSRRRDAEEALHNGDAEPRLALWSGNEPVTVLGAWKAANGQDELRELFRHLEASFSDCLSYSHDIVATQVYRREDGEWKVAHRHADTMPEAGAS
jgi:hypothetical protein